MVLTFVSCTCVWLHTILFYYEFMNILWKQTMIQKDWEYTLLQKECHSILPCEQGADGLTRVHWGVVFFRENVYQASAFALKASFDFCRSFSHIVHIFSVNTLWIKKRIYFYQYNLCNSNFFNTNQIHVSERSAYLKVLLFIM